ncbi:MAG: hypothetical protein LUE10_01920, partial [Alistipes sp.]|nr:hypothetical protein [Alistipes sp.]
IVCITADEPDHFDQETVLALYKYCHNCVIMGPKSVTAHCRRLGFNPARLVTLAPGDNTFSYGNIRVRGVAAYHNDTDAIGLAVNAGKFRVYLSGMTRRDDGIPASVKNALGGNPDVMMLCINGRHRCMD